MSDVFMNGHTFIIRCDLIFYNMFIAMKIFFSFFSFLIREWDVYTWTTDGEKILNIQIKDETACSFRMWECFFEILSFMKCKWGNFNLLDI